MGRATKAFDWQFAGVMSLNASVGLGGGGWLFSFKSKTADWWEDYVLLAAGAAVPGASLEVSLPDVAEDDLCWSPAESYYGFSAADLGNATGEIGSVGASALLVGYSALTLSARGTDQRPLFWQQRNDGFSVGVQVKPVASGAFVGGKYYSLGTVLRDCIIPVINAGLVSLGFGLVMASQGLMQGRAQAVSHRFIVGYARRLADITDAGKWEVSEARFEELKAMKWGRDFDRITKRYKDAGSTFTGTLLDEAEVTGEAAVVQDVANLFATKGADWVAKMFERQRALYGQQKQARRRRYLDILFLQVTGGQTQFGISLSA
ncbi:MAG: hypothetical protein ACRC33_11670 [Gemmataceae bacterium]